VQWSSFFTAFLPVFLAELPDKSMVATLVLTGTHRRPLAVWLGVAGAFTIHMSVATLAGGLLQRLPTRGVAAAAVVLFAAGSVVLWRSRGDKAEAALDTAVPTRSFLRVLLLAFGTILVAELGDLTQLTVAGLAATQPSPFLVFLGGLSAVCTVAGVAVLVGRRLLTKLPIRLLHTGAAIVFALLAAWSLDRVVQG
jgi:Ca2+/H+ antiporter, TMEM165/GDT1 family